MNLPSFLGSATVKKTQSGHTTRLRGPLSFPPYVKSFASGRPWPTSGHPDTYGKSFGQKEGSRHTRPDPFRHHPYYWTNYSSSSIVHTRYWLEFIFFYSVPRGIVRSYMVTWTPLLHNTIHYGSHPIITSITIGPMDFLARTIFENVFKHHNSGPPVPRYHPDFSAPIQIHPLVLYCIYITLGTCEIQVHTSTACLGHSAPRKEGRRYVPDWGGRM